MCIHIYILYDLASLVLNPRLIQRHGRLYLHGLYIAGVVASGAQWMFGIFAVGLQMAIKLKSR